MDHTLSKVVGAFAPAYRTALSLITGAIQTMSSTAIPVTATPVAAAPSVASTLVTEGETALASFLAPVAKGAADSVCKAAGITDPATVAQGETALTELAKFGLLLVAAKLSGLLAPKAK